MEEVRSYFSCCHHHSETPVVSYPLTSSKHESLETWSLRPGEDREIRDARTSCPSPSPLQFHSLPHSEFYVMSAQPSVRLFPSSSGESQLTVRRSQTPNHNGEAAPPRRGIYYPHLESSVPLIPDPSPSSTPHPPIRPTPKGGVKITSWNVNDIVARSAGQNLSSCRRGCGCFEGL